MAKRYSVVTWTEICAFWGMVIAGFTKFFGGVFKATLEWIVKEGAAHDILIKIHNTLSFLGDIALLIAIAVPAYQFVKYKSKGWRVFYWIAFAIFVVAVIFGNTLMLIYN